MNEAFLSQIGDRLKEARKQLGLNQAQAAELVGVTREHWGRCERGAAMPGGEVFASLAAAGTDVNYVLTGQHIGSVKPALDAAERVLLDNYRRCNAEGQAHLIQSSALLSAGLASAAPPAQAKPRAKAQPRSTTAKAGSGAGAIQNFHGTVSGTVVGGDVHQVVNKGRSGQ